MKHTTRRGWSKRLPMTPERQAMNEMAREMRRVELSGERIPQWMREEYSKRVAAHHAQVSKAEDTSVNWG